MQAHHERTGIGARAGRQSGTGKAQTGLKAVSNWPQKRIAQASDEPAPGVRLRWSGEWGFADGMGASLLPLLAQRPG